MGSDVEELFFEHGFGGGEEVETEVVDGEHSPGHCGAEFGVGDVAVDFQVVEGEVTGHGHA